MCEIEIPITSVPKRVPWNKDKLIAPRPPLRQSMSGRYEPGSKWKDRFAIWRFSTWRSIASYAVVTLSPSRPMMLPPTDMRLNEQWYGKKRQADRCASSSRQAIDEYLRVAGKKLGDFLFSGRRPGQSMTTRQYARLLADWLIAIGLDPRVYGTHSLRRTKVTLIYRRTGNLRAVQLLLGHTKIESTVRYLGIEVDDALAISEQVEI